MRHAEPYGGGRRNGLAPLVAWRHAHISGSTGFLGDGGGRWPARESAGHPARRRRPAGVAWSRCRPNAVSAPA